MTSPGPSSGTPNPIDWWVCKKSPSVALTGVESLVGDKESTITVQIGNITNAAVTLNPTSSEGNSVYNSFRFVCSGIFVSDMFTSGGTVDPANLVVGLSVNATPVAATAVRSPKASGGLSVQLSEQQTLDVNDYLSVDFTLTPAAISQGETVYVAVTAYSGNEPATVGTLPFAYGPPGNNEGQVPVSVTLSVLQGETSSSFVGISRLETLPVSNTLKIMIDPTDPWGEIAATDRPSIALSFATLSLSTSDGSGPAYLDPGTINSLTTPTEAANFTVEAQVMTSGGSATNVTWPAVLAGGSSPFWTMQPTASQGSILPDHSYLSVTVSGIQTQFAPGNAPVTLNFNNFPNCQDSVWSSTLQKAFPPIVLNQFTVTSSSGSVVAGGYSPSDESATVNLEWTASGATRFEVTGQGSQPASKPTQNMDGVGVNRTTTFYLIALDEVCGEVASQALTIDMNPSLASSAAPRGTIVAWQGWEADCPAGWMVCNAANAGPQPHNVVVPNLSDLFILGCGNGIEPGQAVSAPAAHQHNLSPVLVGDTEPAGSHSHGPPGWAYQGSTSDTSDTAYGYICHKSGGGANFKTVSDHTHSYTVSLGTVTTNGTAGAVRPPWFALYYIIKL